MDQSKPAKNRNPYIHCTYNVCKLHYISHTLACNLHQKYHFLPKIRQKSPFFCQKHPFWARIHDKSPNFTYFPSNKRDFSAKSLSLLLLALRPRLLNFAKNLPKSSKLRNFFPINRKIVVTSTILVVLSVIFSGFLTNNTFATSITLTIPGSLSLGVNPNTNSGYAKSSNGNISVTADSPFGYTLSIKSKDSTNGNALMNGSNKLASITAAVSENDYKTTTSGGVSSGSSNVNTWGYIPSKVNGTANTNVRPGPGTSGETIEKTSVANASAANSYTVALATKVDKTLASGSYKNTFIISAVANSVNYSITYNLESGSWTGTSPQTGSTPENKVKLSSVTPTRANYTFKGWCSVQPTNNSGTSPSCSGTLYQPSNEYTLTNSSNEVNLYAMWQSNSRSYTIRYASNVGSPSSMPTTQSGSVASPYNVTISSNTPTLSGYTFKGWCSSSTSSATCSGTTYARSGSITIPNDGYSITLYAMWEETKPSSPPTTMQTFGSYCKWMTQHQTLTLTDSRDSNTYTVAKLKDNKCWMTQNLRLGRTSTMSLSSSTSDISSSYTLPASSTSGFSSDSAQNIFVSTNTSYGGYYTWAVATAGTNPSSGEASRSICPKGWRLPTYTEFSTLTKNYTYTTIQQSPANFVLAGYYNSSSMYDSGTRGFWWSSTAVSSTEAFLLELRSSNSNFSTALSGKRNGNSIRCVSRQ